MLCFDSPTGIPIPIPIPKSLEDYPLELLSGQELRLMADVFRHDDAIPPAIAEIIPPRIDQPCVHVHGYPAVPLQIEIRPDVMRPIGSYRNNMFSRYLFSSHQIDKYGSKITTITSPVRKDSRYRAYPGVCIQILKIRRYVLVAQAGVIQNLATRLAPKPV